MCWPTGGSCLKVLTLPADATSTRSTATAPSRRPTAAIMAATATPAGRWLPGTSFSRRATAWRASPRPWHKRWPSGCRPRDSPGQWLVAASAGSGSPLSLCRLDVAMQCLERLPGPNAGFRLQPVVVAARKPPLRHPSALMPQRGAGNLLCLNTYVSKRVFPEGSIGAARFYTLGEAGAERLLGETRVERDGSFYVQVPPDQPIRLEVLDRSGRTLEAEHGWFWMRKGEQRVCVGCHAGPERAPENAVPEVLLRSTKPVKLTGGK